MTSHELVLISGLLAIASGLPALLSGKRSNAGQTLATLILLAANAIGFVSIFRWWIDGTSVPLSFPRHFRELV